MEKKSMEKFGGKAGGELNSIINCKQNVKWKNESHLCCYSNTK